MRQVTNATTGEAYQLGQIRMRLLAGTRATGGAFSLGDFEGGPGAWTIPHVHRTCEESFYVVEGAFTFTVGEGTIAAGPGSFLMVPRGSPHTIHAKKEYGRFLTLWTPGGLEELFIALSGMPPDSLRDPEARRLLSTRFDSVPVEQGAPGVAADDPQRQPSSGAT